MAALPAPLTATAEHFNFATDVVDKWALIDPSLRAMLWTTAGPRGNSPPRTFTYRYFRDQSHRAAHLLRDLGVQRGDRLMIVSNRVPAWRAGGRKVISTLILHPTIATAAIRSGVVLCPCTVLATPKDIEYRVQASQCTIFVGNRSTISAFLGVKSRCPSVRVILQIDGEPHEDAVQYRHALKQTSLQDFIGPKTTWSDPCIIYFTSGTTGLPKMVLHNQVSYPLAHASTGKYWLDLDQSKVFWTLAEQGWAKAGWSWFATWNMGATLFIQDDRGAFSPQSLIDTLAEHDITTLCAPPTAYRQLVTPDLQAYFAQRRPRALQHCVSAGEPLNPEAVNVWKAMSGIEIKDAYGQTETTMAAGNFVGVKVKLGSMGKATPGVPLDVIDEQGNIAPDNTEGDLAVKVVDEHGRRTMGVYDGYISKDGQVSRATRVSSSSSSSLSSRSRPGKYAAEWHITGDRAYRDADGYLWFVGRSDDVINSSGYRIGPFEVESVLKQHPAVLESAVVASPDANRGEVVKAFIVPTQDYRDRAFAPETAASLIRAIQDFCKKEAAPYKYPRKIQFVEPAFLPKTTSGKIQRGVLRRMENAAAATKTMRGSHGDAKL
ncbi:hypothetical protein Z517_08208 [Fonsecaea pedrosoi CBS 271.37]|uniref:medium-chain acyl-CoA ligase n=1 Tax=Fonsecaea pedrosoi CBS 271.37 TaxID=1442368 RepID=A0A0D2GCG3_9EURO|nr:uncharacterized protein Z517_08208 [Fonsecaea pedrosoi CBS 271.37]KIW78373.1 hypothetical protein Z517_08208 [Fonsecaea pedrosoi CBS 271.37]